MAHIAYTLIFHLVPVAFRTTSPTRFAEQGKQVERAKTFTMRSCENGKTILENSISAAHYAASNHRSFCLFRQKRSLLLFHLQTSESLFAVLSFIARMDFLFISSSHWCFSVMQCYSKAQSCYLDSSECCSFRWIQTQRYLHNCTHWVRLAIVGAHC